MVSVCGKRGWFIRPERKGLTEKKISVLEGGEKKREEGNRNGIKENEMFLTGRSKGNGLHDLEGRHYLKGALEEAVFLRRVAEKEKVHRILDPQNGGSKGTLGRKKGGVREKVRN